MGDEEKINRLEDEVFTDLDDQQKQKELALAILEDDLDEDD